MKNDQRFFKLKYKIWLDSTGKAFGKGPCEILNRVERLGSLKGATEEMFNSCIYRIIEAK
jgi:molybdenum-dependent DNA-binding transcriptional regulator ModE